MTRFLPIFAIEIQVKQKIGVNHHRELKDGPEILHEVFLGQMATSEKLENKSERFV